MVKLSDIIALEYKLNQIKLEMNSMLAASGEGNQSAILQDRIAFLESQIEHLSRQLELMKGQSSKVPGPAAEATGVEAKVPSQGKTIPEVNTIAAATVRPAASTVASTTVTPAASTVATTTVTPAASTVAASTVMQSRQNTAQVSPTVQINRPVPPSPRRDLEHTVGKNVMGIVASCLIFIGLILFGIIIYPFLTDNIRLLAMYAVSLAFIVFGYIKSEKQPNNKFYISLLACGTGAIYITLLMTSIYFKKIDELVLYILLFIWSLIACFLSKKRGALFQIIGELGLLISLIFGIYYCYNEQSQLYSFILLGYFVLSSTVYLLMHYRKTLEGNLIHFIMHIIAAYAFAAACLSFDSFFSAPAIVIFSWIVAAYIYSHILISNVLMEEKSGVTLCIINLFYALAISIVILEAPLGGEIGRGIINVAFCLIMLALQAHSLKDSPSSKTVCDCGIMVLAFWGIAVLGEGAMSTVLALVLALLGILFGAWLNNLAYQIGGYVFLFTYLFTKELLPAYADIALSLVVLVVLFFTVKKFYKTNTKVCNYIFFMCILYLLGNRIIEALSGVLTAGSDWYNALEAFLPILLLSGAQLLFVRCGLHKHWITKEKEQPSTIAFAITHIVIMLAALAYIANFAKLREIMILLAIVLFLVNNKAIMDSSPSVWPGIYVLGKLTLLLIVSVNAYDSPEYLISVACFILSVISIILGFKFRRKSFRTYGLVLSLISVAKLVMVDIHYENTIGRAASFLVCGVLCFVINIIYNRIDKMNEENNS